MLLKQWTQGTFVNNVYEMILLHVLFYGGSAAYNPGDIRRQSASLCSSRVENPAL